MEERREILEYRHQAEINGYQRKQKDARKAAVEEGNNDNSITHRVPVLMSEHVTVGILSDTHGYLDERIAEVIRDCDYAIHAGDIMGAHILDQLQPRQRVFAVAGNNDHPSIWNSEETDVVSALPKMTEFELPGGTVRIEHGHRLGGFPDHDQLRWDHADVRLVVYGHTHKRIIDQQDEPWIVNPGAAGRERTKGGPSCLILRANESEWTFETVVFADRQQPDNARKQSPPTRPGT